MKKSKKVSKLVKKLIRKHGSVEAVAKEFNQSTRYIEMLRDGKPAGWSLAELMRIKL